ncbi:MAG TPA: MBL fold metallo-hydrolase [Novimethylophilus sp.]|uniref:MBL fold metallo-hydrolase n=1 Tax=Novimethylophilus sp. TaxID=2137426 RepID=UPI002F3EF609
MQLIVLGVGSSAGTPVIGCDCATCTSADPRNNRTRCSSAIETDGGEIILIDTAPDLRLQSLRENIRRVDAVLYTHIHADHLNGIDDLRAFCQMQKKQIPLYGNAYTIDNIGTRFGYTLHEPGTSWEMPVLRAEAVDGPFDICGERVIPIPVKHGRANILGWRIRNFAYLTDISEIPPGSMELLHGLDVVLLDCLRFKPHHTHINVEQSLAYASLIGARQTYLIHMTHELEYAMLQSGLPAGVNVGYDGLRLALA